MAGPPFAAFYFDCDSTLSAIEGVDELTRGLAEDLRLELRGLTEAAMEGRVPLAEVYEQRLGVLAPGREALEEIGRVYVENLVPDAVDTVQALIGLGKHVGIISGGLRQAVAILARHLAIPDANVHAVPVILDDEGRYLDYDRTSPLWRNQGKVKVLEALPLAHSPLLFTGDGVTDLEARPVVDLFVGFGGVERRERVAAEAEVYIDRNTLAPLLEIGLTEDERVVVAARYPHLNPKRPER
jgi:phosphoserine phosphatase